jgi:hypothetical protein
MFSSMKTIAFLFWCVMVGFVFGAMGLHFWLLEDLGGNKSCDDSRNIKLLQGLCLTVNCIGNGESMETFLNYFHFKERPQYSSFPAFF